MAKTKTKKNVRTKKATAAYVAKMAGVRENREKWLKALESGRYSQAEAQLRDVEYSSGSASYCCLGVLCNQHKDKLNKWVDGDTFTVFGSDGVEIDSFHEMPPANILKKVNLPQSLADELASMNDNGKTFKEIAAFLRKKWRMPKA
jgi:hypothetical protein